MGAGNLADIIEQMNTTISTEKTPLTGLILGHGSIGRRHAQALAPMVANLAIVEIQEPALAQARQAHPTAKIVDRLESLDSENFPWASTVAVIATWGPSHAALFHALADRGVRRILCEKPMANSVALAHEIAARADREGITLGVHHFIRYTRLAPELRNWASEHKLGDPVAVVIQGGAACLVTNGLHWIDFATELFGTNPKQVISSACGAKINPRSPDLMLYGGTAIWTFGNGREAVITFNNESSVALSTRIYFRNAVAETDSDVGRVVIRHRDRTAIERYPAVTRTGPATEPLFEGLLPGMRPFDEGLRVALRQVANGDLPTASVSIGVSAVSSCIGMLA